jgi:hypothetical protein
MKRDALRAAIAALASKPPTKVSVPEIGDLLVRQLSVGEVEENARDSKSADPFRIARALARVLCDEDGSLIYDPKSDDDVGELAKAPFSVMNKVLDAANKAAGLDDEDGKQAEKN